MKTGRRWQTLRCCIRKNADWRGANGILETQPICGTMALSSRVRTGVISGKQLGFSDYEPTAARKQTKPGEFLATIGTVDPWDALIALSEPHYPKTTKKGRRPPYPLATMLQMHLLPQWNSLRDPAMEEALIEVPTKGGLRRCRLPRHCQEARDSRHCSRVSGGDAARRTPPRAAHTGVKAARSDRDSHNPHPLQG